MKIAPQEKKQREPISRSNSQELMRQLNIVRGRSPQSDDVITAKSNKRKKGDRKSGSGTMREMVPKSFSFSDAFFQYSNGRLFSGSERVYITGKNCILTIIRESWKQNPEPRNVTQRHFWKQNPKHFHEYLFITINF